MVEILPEQRFKIPVVKSAHVLTFFIGSDIIPEIFRQDEASQHDGCQKVGIELSVPQQEKLHGDFILKMGSAAGDQMMDIMIFHFRDHAEAMLSVKFAEFPAQGIFLKFQQLFFRKPPLPFLFLKIFPVKFLGFIVNEKQKANA